MRSLASVLVPVLVVAGVTACCRSVVTRAPDASDAGSSRQGGTCAAACAHWRGAGCAEGRPTATGEACEALCERELASRLFKADAWTCAAQHGDVAGLVACGAGCTSRDAGE